MPLPNGLVRHLTHTANVTVALLFSSCLCSFAQTSVLTQHNDLARTGQNLTETILTPATVSAGNFGKLFSLTVDATVEAQPLYMPAVNIGGATHNVIFLATEHDSVFAFDADSGGAPLWQASMFDQSHGASSGATSVSDTVSSCYIVNGEYGISGTPVIDPSTGTFYVVSITYENNFPIHRLHALDVKTGAEKFGGPTAITASTPGTGAGSSNGTLTFNPAIENQRAGLALANGQVYIAFAANCDLSNYHGWLFAYNAATLAQSAAFIASPNGMDSGIWMGAAAPSFDTANGAVRMFITTGNGTFDATHSGGANSDYGDDILRFDLSNGFIVADSFTPYNQAFLSTTDTDLGSGVPLILPDQPGTYPHLMVEASKGGVIYLVNRDNLGGYSTSLNNVVQELDNQVGPSYGVPAYWNGNIYLWPSAGPLSQFTLTNGLLSSTPVAVSTQVQSMGLGSTPSISANGTANAIVWSIDSSQSTQVLYAHDATNVAKLLWSSATNAARDNAGQAIKFQFPTVANGKVYVSSNGQVLVYGLPDFALTPSLPSLTVAPGGTATLQINLSGTLTNAVNLTCSVASSLANVTCSIPATISGGFSTPVLTITASSQAAAPLWRATPQWPIRNRTVLYLAAGLVLMNSLLPIIRRRKRFLGIGFATLSFACISSCGGGGSTASSFSGPVAESGLVTVVGTSGTLTHTATISVTVQ